MKNANLLIDIFYLPVKRVSARKPRSDKGFTNKQIAKLREQFKAVINEVSDERDTADGVWFYPIAGYGIPADGIHCVHEWTYEAAVEQLNRIIKCNCQDCI